MYTSRQEFIKDNQDALNSYYLKADTKCQPVFGFGSNSPKEAFKAALEDADEFYLPLCFLYIFWENTDVESRDFVLQSLENLYWIDDKGQLTDPTMAYVHSYCLLQTDKENESFDVLKTLSYQCFPPALATMGDGAVANHEIVNAVHWYDHAIDHGYLSIVGRRNKLVYKNNPFPKSIAIEIVLKVFAATKWIKFIGAGMKGERVLYLDFYSMGYHFKKYWEIPRAERIQKIEKEAAHLRELSNKQKTV